MPSFLHTNLKYFLVLRMFLFLGVLSTISLLLSPNSAKAQSFNCAEAQFSAEFAICNNEELLSLDEKVAKIFYLHKSNMPTIPQRQKFARDHSAWILKRNRCDLDWTCLQIRYKERIFQLSPGIIGGQKFTF